jgi:uncharacterized membrane protein YcjF (UPF0283 family)
MIKLIFGLLFLMASIIATVLLFKENDAAKWLILVFYAVSAIFVFVGIKEISKEKKWF